MKAQQQLLPALAVSLFATNVVAAEVEKPNIIIIMADQQRADLSARYGYALDVTPFVDQMAAEGAWFDKAYTTAPASSPARCSMLTGRYPSATRVQTNHNVEDIHFEKDMIGVLRDNGYKRAMVGKNHAYLKPADMNFWSTYGHWGKTKAVTAAEKETVRFLREEAFGQWLDPSPIELTEQMPTKIVDETLNWIDKVKGDPFFAWVSFPEPHNPYQVCEPYYSMFAPESIPALKTSKADAAKKGEKYQILSQLIGESCPDLDEDMGRIRANYLGMIRLIDDQIKRLVEGLKESGEYDNTIIVVVSDHGDYFGEYGLIHKGAGLSEALARIPMVWSGGAVEQHKKCLDAHVSIADVFPTLCSAIGAEIPMGVQGRSLWPILCGENYPEREFSSIVMQQGFGGEDISYDESDRSFLEEGCLVQDQEAHFDELNTWTQSGMRRMIRRDDWKMIVDSYGVCELYNLKSDPAELDNLSGKRKYSKVEMSMLNDLMAWELRLQDPLPIPRKRYDFKRNDYNYHYTK